MSRRDENIAANNEKLASLGLPLTNTCNEQPKKRAKRTHNTNVDATRVHNLRPRPQTRHAMNANEQVEEDVLEEDLAEDDLSEDDWECESTGDFLCDNEDFHRNTQKKRNERGISKLDEVFARKPGMPKIKVMINEYGQPVGENARRFSGAIGVHVRQKISIACADWRLVDPKIKDATWDDIKEFFDIEDEDEDKAHDWFLDAAGKKWKDFKANLKKQYFKGEITEEKIRTKQGERLNDDDWNFLKNHWSTPESVAQTEIAKANRAKLSIHHTTGSKSFACNRHEMANELGRPPRRDEFYVKAHTRKMDLHRGSHQATLEQRVAELEAELARERLFVKCQVWKLSPRMALTRDTKRAQDPKKIMSRQIMLLNFMKMVPM